MDYAAIADGLEYEVQQAFIWVPDDPRMKRVVEYIQNEQQLGIKLAKEKPAGDGTPDEPPPKEDEFFLALSSEMDDRYYADTDVFYSMSESELLERICEQYSTVRHWPPKRILDLYRDGGLPISNTAPKEQKPQEKYRKNQIEYYKELSDGREQLSRLVHKLCCQCDAKSGNPFGTFAGQFGSQKAWGIKELWDLREIATNELTRIKSEVA